MYMIARLTGDLIEVQPLFIVIDVHGVGYRVFTASGSGFVLGAKTTLHTYLAVRETAQDLYGFSTASELDMFEHLIKLPKIGPKTAIQILSQADITIIKKAVQTNDPTYLSKMSGIGKKSAEKIVAGLTDVFGEEVFDTEVSSNQRDSDILDALMTLGYSQRDALQAVQKIPAEITDTNARIKYALKTVSS